MSDPGLGRPARPQRRGLPASAPSPLLDLPLGPAAEPPFLRPKARTGIRRVRRGALRRWVVILEACAILLAALAGIKLGYSKVMASERLRVGRLEVQGNRFLSEGEVRELLGPSLGENILTLDIVALKSRLQASPWVADATVARVLPDTIRVEIHERTPLALAEVDRLYLMDTDGVLIEIYGPRTAGFDLPIVRGLQGLDLETRGDRARRAGTLLFDVGELAAEVSEVEVEPSGDLKVVLRGAGEVLLMGPPPYRRKLLTFLGLRKDLQERCPGAAYFDLRFRNRIYAKPATTAPTAGPPAPAEPPAKPEALMAPLPMGADEGRPHPG